MSYRVHRSVLLTATRTGKLDLHGLNIDKLPEEVFSSSVIDHVNTLDLSGNNIGKSSLNGECAEALNAFLN